MPGARQREDRGRDRRRRRRRRPCCPERALRPKSSFSRRLALRQISSRSGGPPLTALAPLGIVQRHRKCRMEEGRVGSDARASGVRGRQPRRRREAASWAGNRSASAARNSAHAGTGQCAHADARSIPDGSRSTPGGDPASRRSCCRRGSAARDRRRSRRSTASTAAICSSRFGCAASITCSSRSASRRFRERRAERSDEIVRQLADEADGVGEHDRRGAGHVDPAQRRVERREQLVGGERLGAGEAVEQRRLAGVGVADERDGAHRGAAPRAALRRALARDVRQALLQHLDALAEQPAVGLELRFAGAAEADAALLALEVGPAADEPRQLMLDLRELDLQLAFGAARALREDVEDQRGAVDDAALECALEVALLRARERVVEDDEIGGRFGRGAPRSPRPCPCRRTSPRRAAGGGP